MAWNDSKEAECIMICIDLMKTNASQTASGISPFWLFKPSLFEGDQFANEEESPNYHQAFSKMMEIPKKKKGEDVILLHTNKNREWRHNMLVTWVEKKEGTSVQDQVIAFMQEFNQMMMQLSCQSRLYENAQSIFSEALTDMMKPINTMEKRPSMVLSGQHSTPHAWWLSTRLPIASKIISFKSTSKTLFRISLKMDELHQ